MSMVSPRHQPVSSSSMGGMDDFLNLDMTSSSTSIGAGETGDYYTDLFPSPSPRLSDMASPSSATTFLPATPPLQPQTALDTIDITNHAVFNDLYRTYIEPLQMQNSASKTTEFQNGLGGGVGAMGPGAFSFNDLFASYAAAATASVSSVNSSSNPTTAATSMSPSETMLPQATSGMGASAATTLGGFPFTIDPQLVATPALKDISSTLLALPTPPKSVTAPTTAVNNNKSVPRASTASVDEEDEDDDDEEDDDEDMLPTKSGKGDKGKKLNGGVSTGGIVKRTGATSCVVRDADSNDPDDWRPSPEEYKKLSSKEKRQLRNKISARNFRVRRKEYITTLENQISDRDKLIDAIRDELGAQQLQNSELRQEIDALKKAMLDGRHPHPVGLPPPTPLTALSQPTTTTRKSAKSALAKANPNKDVAAGGSKGFWGGAHGGMGMGGITPVHSAFSILPDGGVSLASVLSGKGAGYTISTMPTPTPPTSGPGAKWLAALQENINPQLNVHRGSTTSPSTSSSSSSGSEGAASPASSHSDSTMPSPQTPPTLLPSQAQQPQQQWNGYSDINPFTIKTLDSYRLQLWAKMAQDSAQQAQVQQFQQQQAQMDMQYQQQQAQQQNLFNTFYSSGLSGGLKPRYFAASKDAKEKSEKESAVPKGSSPTLSAMLAGKAVSSLASSSSTSPLPMVKREPTSSPLLPPSSALPSVASAQATLAATAISHSIVSRMGTAFWDAFSASSSTSSATQTQQQRPASTTPTSGSSRNWDMDKVQRVLEGKAVLKVVDVDGPPAAADVGLEEKLSAMNLGASGSSKPSPSQPVWGQRRSTAKDCWVGSGPTEKKSILGS
ncbi:hypothetical protein FRB94_002643 [Tulasnella sp. JGI-2019a]|nr:hypothetical protein FRB94_002643 [Tulasnella sp. JGI-2019a]